MPCIAHQYAPCPPTHTHTQHGGSDSHFGTFPSSNKKRHVALSAAGDKGHEGVESDWVLPASLSFYQAQETRILQLMISEVSVLQDCSLIHV